MTRILLHPGFHKTGTTSLQGYLSDHQTVLAPYLTYYGKDALAGPSGWAQSYGQRPYTWRLGAFRRAFARVLKAIPDAPVIVLSRETFCGAMPGHRDWLGREVTSYGRQAIPLCRHAVAALRRRFGAGAEIELLLTTRGQEPWLRSVYGHLVRSIDLTEDEDTFVARRLGRVDLEHEAQAIASALPGVSLHLSRLEDLSQRPLGPASAVLDRLDLPSGVVDSLPQPRRRNPRQSPELETEFLALNRSNLPKGVLRARKAALLRAAGPHG